MRYTPREYRDLHLRRSRVALVGTVLLDYLFFVLNYRQLLLSPLFLSISTYSTLYATTCIRSYPPHEAHIHHAPVEIPFEVEQMSLDAPLTPLEGRGHPDVGAGGVNVLSDAHEPGIHPPARDDHGRVGEHVRGREADALPPPVPDDHLTSQDVGSPQQPGGLLHLAPGYERPDAGRAYTALSVFAPDGHRMGLSTEGPHEASEIPGVARRPVAEPEVLPYHDDL